MYTTRFWNLFKIVGNSKMETVELSDTCIIIVSFLFS